MVYPGGHVVVLINQHMYGKDAYIAYELVV
jgi:hypothetical protein